MNKVDQLKWLHSVLLKGAENVELEDTCWFSHEATRKVSALQISVYGPVSLAEEQQPQILALALIHVSYGSPFKH